ncbi:MAG: KpsF/GutQ family sugar-phosphate isomerase [Opitutae bacterium]|nr:KpsF/GutQ family sugar-phosphate isomerase [Opitutae bacterium]
MDNHQELAEAQRVLSKEANSIIRASESLGQNFSQSVDCLYTTRGKIVVSGIGKSGHLGKKLAATFCSTGSPAAFLHPSEAVHGDLGIHQEGDPVVFLSNSGSTPELLALAPLLRGRSAKIVGIFGNEKGQLTSKVDAYLDSSVPEEADPLGIVPTASFAVSASLGDALASALMKRRNFSELDYAQTHPAGQLGRNLILRVSDIMHQPPKIACVGKQTKIKDLVIEMTKFPLGAACIVEGDQLLGIVTDGDLRRALSAKENLLEVSADGVMTITPQSINPDVSLGNALKVMEDRESPISVLPVACPKSNKLLGMIRLHDIYTPSSN